MNTPNKITIARIVMVPIFILAMLCDFRGHTILSLVIFALAGASDSLDGYLARRNNLVTDFGKFADPLADKILIMSAMLIFVENGQMPSWCACIILAREFAVTGLRLIAVENGAVIAAGIAGKIKTFVSTIACCVMISPWPATRVLSALPLDSVCVFLMVVLTVWSGVIYFIRNGGVLKNAK